MITLCEQCFPSWGEHEVLSIVPLGPCAKCGKNDETHKQGTRCYVFRVDPRQPIGTLHIEGKLLPTWKTVDCPTCDSKAGQSCGQQAPGAFHWERTAPHAARRKAGRVMREVVTGRRAADPSTES